MTTEKAVRVAVRIPPEGTDDEILERGIRLLAAADMKEGITSLEYHALSAEIARLRDLMQEPDRMGEIAEEPLVFLQEKVIPISP